MNGNDNGANDTGNGGYVAEDDQKGFLKIPPISPSIKEKYDLDVAQMENERMLAEAELERSKTEFLEAQIGKADPAKIPLVNAMPEQGIKPFPWILIAAALWFAIKFFK